MTKAIRRTAACLAVLLGCVSAAAAHHAANVMFDLNSEPLELKGVLTRYANVNPHTRIEFDAKDASGKVTHWSLAAPSPANLTRLGLNAKRDMVVGAMYTFRLVRARDGSDNGLLMGMVLPDGRNITIVLSAAERGERREH
jgi:hypothetical protein